MRLLIDNHFNKDLVFIIILSALLSSNSALGQWEAHSFIADSIISQDTTKDIIVYGPTGTTEHLVIINKDIYSKKDHYLPGEPIQIRVEVKFKNLKYNPWNLSDIIINEVIDKELKLENNSIKWAIISDIFETPDYKNRSDSRINNFAIKLDREISSFQRIIYFYNVTVTKPGLFYATTIMPANINAAIHADTEKSLVIRIEDYDVISPIFDIIKQILIIIGIFAGFFAFYKNIKAPEEKRTIRNILLEMIQQIKDLVESIPYAITVFLYLFFVFLWWFRISVSAYIATNVDFINNTYPLVLLTTIALYLLYLNKDLNIKLNEFYVIIFVILVYHIFIFFVYKLVNPI